MRRISRWPCWGMLPPPLIYIAPLSLSYLVGPEAAVITHEGHDDHLLEVRDVRQTHARLALLATGVTRRAHHHHLPVTPSLQTYLFIRIHGRTVEVLIL